MSPRLVFLFNHLTSREIAALRSRKSINVSIASVIPETRRHFAPEVWHGQLLGCPCGLRTNASFEGTPTQRGIAAAARFIARAQTIELRFSGINIMARPSQ